MNPSGEWLLEETGGRLRGLLIATEKQLSGTTVAIIDELIDSNEQEIAAEMLSDMLVEAGSTIASTVFATYCWVAEAMRMDPISVEQLRPLVR